MASNSFLIVQNLNKFLFYFLLFQVVFKLYGSAVEGQASWRQAEEGQVVKGNTYFDNNVAFPVARFKGVLYHVCLDSFCLTIRNDGLQ